MIEAIGLVVFGGACAILGGMHVTPKDQRAEDHEKLLIGCLAAMLIAALVVTKT